MLPYNQQISMVTCVTKTMDLSVCVISSAWSNTLPTCPITLVPTFYSPTSVSPTILFDKISIITIPTILSIPTTTAHNTHVNLHGQA